MNQQIRAVGGRTVVARLCSTWTTTSRPEALPSAADSHAIGSARSLWAAAGATRAAVSAPHMQCPGGGLHRLLGNPLMRVQVPLAGRGISSLHHTGRLARGQSSSMQSGSVSRLVSAPGAVQVRPPSARQLANGSNSGASSAHGVSAKSALACGAIGGDGRGVSSAASAWGRGSPPTAPMRPPSHQGSLTAPRTNLTRASPDAWIARPRLSSTVPAGRLGITVSVAHEHLAHN